MSCDKCYILELKKEKGWEFVGAYTMYDIALEDCKKEGTHRIKQIVMDLYKPTSYDCEEND